MDQHLQVLVVLDVVALQESNLPVDDHVLGMEGAQERRVEIHNLYVNVWDFARVREVDILSGKVLLGNNVVWLVDLLEASAVVENLKHHPCASRSGTTV